MVGSVNKKNFEIYEDKNHKLKESLNELLKKHHINMAELARGTGLPQPTIQRLFSGKTEDPKISTLMQIADYFSVSLDQLLGNSPLNNLSRSHLSKVSSIPILSWEDASKYEPVLSEINTTNWNDWVFTEKNISTKSFGLRSKRSMEPRFPTGSILTIDPDVVPQDGDLVIVQYENTLESTIREITLDGPIKKISPITGDRSEEDLSLKIKVLGVVVQTKYSYK